MIKPERFSSLRVQRYYIFFILQIIKRKNMLLLKNYARKKQKRISAFIENGQTSWMPC